MKIYHFSATGNSRTTAQMLAERLGDCELIPVASLRNERKVIETDDAVGFVFPVYYGNMPWPVRDLISRMVFPKDCYVFIVTTWRGHAGDVAGRMDMLLRTRGVALSLAQGIPMPGNSFINAPEVDAKYLAAQAENVDGLVPAIAAREVREYAVSGLLPQTPIDYPNNFRGITADENCIGCGTCARVCPMDNIRIVDGHAEIGDDCATCLACFHWCPRQAIWMSRQENIARREKYRHPGVKLANIIGQKG